MRIPPPIPPRARGWNSAAMERRVAGRVATLAERDRADVKQMDRIHPRHGLCYFIGCEEGLVKIGHSRQVSRRLAQLRAVSPFPLKLLATATGGAEREAYYHSRFAADRRSGEWFERSAAIEAEIARLSAAAGRALAEAAHA